MRHIFGKLQEDAGGTKFLEIHHLTRFFNHADVPMYIDIGIESGKKDRHSHRVLLDESDVRELNLLFCNVVKVLDSEKNAREISELTTK